MTLAIHNSVPKPDSDGIHASTSVRVVGGCALSAANIVKFLHKADRMRPAYCIALRPGRQQVLLVVRGTRSIGDAITILTGSLALQVTVCALDCIDIKVSQAVLFCSQAQHEIGSSLFHRASLPSGGVCE